MSRVRVKVSVNVNRSHRVDRQGSARGPTLKVELTF